MTLLTLVALQIFSNRSESIWDEFMKLDKWPLCSCQVNMAETCFITLLSGTNDKIWGADLAGWGEGGSVNNTCLYRHIKVTDRQTDRLTSSNRRTTSVFPQRAAWCSAVPDSDCLLISIPAWISNLQVYVHKIMILIILKYLSKHIPTFITIKGSL